MLAPIIRMPFIFEEIVSAEPTIPISPPNKVYEAILPILKYMLGLNFCIPVKYGWDSAYFAVICS